jgi:hypothetical protein
VAETKDQPTAGGDEPVAEPLEHDATRTDVE